MYTVLMVDDEENIRRAVIDAVNWESMGFTIIGEASNGFEALDFLEKNDVDLLVTDIMMPIMGGIELAKATREAKPNVQIVFLSGYDQFNLAKQAIQYNILSYILKPITQKQIKSEFAGIKDKMDEKFLEILNIDEHIDTRKELQNVKRDLLLTNLAQNGLSPWRFQALFSEAGLKVPAVAEPDHLYAVWVVKSDDVSELEEVKHKRLYNIVKIISQKYLTCECTLYGDAVFVVGYGTRTQLDKYLNILPNDILLAAKRIINMNIYFGQSNYYVDILKTALAYTEAVDAVTSIEKTDEQIIHIGDLVQAPEVFGQRELMRQLESTILAGDKDSLPAILEQAFLTVQSEDITGFHGCALEILVILHRTRKTLGDETAVDMKGVKTITFLSGKSEVRRELLELSNRIVDSIAGRRQKTGDVLVHKAMDIIQAEFSDPDMSLQQLAERLHCSSNYLSSVIKKVVGKSFIDLLVDARMNHAHQLLVTTTKRIREISEECGYANQHYFSYAVKKYYNQSPNVIRKSASQQ
ncbi:MAG: response regulator [Eubacteriales bacterium]